MNLYEYLSKNYLNASGKLWDIKEGVDLKVVFRDIYKKINSGELVIDDLKDYKDTADLMAENDNERANYFISDVQNILSRVAKEQTKNLSDKEFDARKYMSSGEVCGYDRDYYGKGFVPAEIDKAPVDFQTFVLNNFAKNGKIYNLKTDIDYSLEVERLIYKMKNGFITDYQESNEVAQALIDENQKEIEKAYRRDLETKLKYLVHQQIDEHILGGNEFSLSDFEKGIICGFNRDELMGKVAFFNDYKDAILADERRATDALLTGEKYQRDTTFAEKERAYIEKYKANQEESPEESDDISIDDNLVNLVEEQIKYDMQSTDDEESLEDDESKQEKDVDDESKEIDNNQEIEESASKVKLNESQSKEDEIDEYEMESGDVQNKEEQNLSDDDSQDVEEEVILNEKEVKSDEVFEAPDKPKIEGLFEDAVIIEDDDIEVDEEELKNVSTETFVNQVNGLNYWLRRKTGAGKLYDSNHKVIPYPKEESDKFEQNKKNPEFIGTIIDSYVQMKNIHDTRPWYVRFWNAITGASQTETKALDSLKEKIMTVTAFSKEQIESAINYATVNKGQAQASDFLRGKTVYSSELNVKKNSLNDKDIEQLNLSNEFDGKENEIEEEVVYSIDSKLEKNTKEVGVDKEEVEKEI